MKGNALPKGIYALIDKTLQILSDNIIKESFEFVLFCSYFANSLWAVIEVRAHVHDSVREPLRTDYAFELLIVLINVPGIRRNFRAVFREKGNFLKQTAVYAFDQFTVLIKVTDEIKDILNTLSSKTPLSTNLTFLSPW